MTTSGLTEIRNGFFAESKCIEKRLTNMRCDYPNSNDQDKKKLAKLITKNRELLNICNQKLNEIDTRMNGASNHITLKG